MSWENQRYGNQIPDKPIKLLFSSLYLRRKKKLLSFRDHFFVFNLIFEYVSYQNFSKNFDKNLKHKT